MCVSILLNLSYQTPIHVHCSDTTPSHADWYDPDLKVLHFLHEYPAIGTIFGALIGASTAILIARIFTRGIKSVDATFEFSKRYHDTQIMKPLNDKKDEWDEWWVRFFDLMYFQYQFYIRGLLLNERFREWMGWRNSEWHSSFAKGQKLNDICYAAGWEVWLERGRSNKFGLFVLFMHRVHTARDFRHIAFLVWMEKILIIRRMRILIRLLSTWRNSGWKTRSFSDYK